MKIIISGAGEVGTHLAKLLSFEAQDITLIDHDRERLAVIESQLDIRTIHGNATSIETLLEAQVDTADLMVGVTSNEAANFTLCILAKQLGCNKTVARIRDTSFIKHKERVNYQSLGIDELISPEELAADEIKELLNQSAFNDAHDFEGGLLRMIGLTLPPQSKFNAKSIKQTAEEYPDLHFMPVAVKRFDSEQTIIPRGDTVLNEGDTVNFITNAEGINEINKLIGNIKTTIKTVMILGGGSVGVNTAKDLAEQRFNVKLIERKKEKAELLTDLLPNTLIIHGDGRNVELLDDEALDSMDAFIAVTGDSETNIISCLLAKTKGVKKTIALVENMDYFQLSQSIGIDTLINKKLIAANAIFRYVREGTVLAVAMLNNLEAEILEFEVQPNTLIENRFIKDLDFPREAVIGGVIRQGMGKIALGNFKIIEGDKVLVCATSNAIKKVERLFR